jgi:hypothetical protein
VVGGLPAGFADSPVPVASRAAIRGIFNGAGARFLDLGDRARYPRSAFFDTPDHLNEVAQIDHSRVVAHALIDMFGAPGAAAPTLAPARAASR